MTRPAATAGDPALAFAHGYAAAITPHVVGLLRGVPPAVAAAVLEAVVRELGLMPPGGAA